MVEPTWEFNFVRSYLAAFFTFVALFYFIRIKTNKQRNQVRLVHTGPKFSATWSNHMAFRFFRKLIWFICEFRLPFPAIDNYLLLFPNLISAPINLAGIVILTFAFGFTVYVHLAMGTQWRSGIDTEQPTKLLTTGLFAWSRNPMYLGVLSAQFGFFLALPSVFTLLCLVAGFVFIFKQTLAEEAYLLKVHQADYLNYQQSVRRWF